MEFLGSLISGASSLLGGIFNRNSADKAAQANLAAQTAAAQNQVTWRAADARNAEAKYGINALVGMGAPTVSLTPTAVGDTSFGSGVAAAGQDIGRAINSVTHQQSRAEQLNEQLLEAKIANVNSDTVRNQALASEIATKASQPATANVPLPPENPMGPVIQKYVRVMDRDGRMELMLNPKIATSYQTPASFPQQIGTAIRDTYHGIRDSLGFGGATTAERNASSAQYDPYVPF